MALQTAALPTSQEGHSSACTSHMGSGHKPSPRYSSKGSVVQPIAAENGLDGERKLGPAGAVGMGSSSLGVSPHQVGKTKARVR